MSDSPKIVVIGAGAAGMLAAAEAARRGAQVILLEKNTKTGVKILMSGGTRCNLTQDTDARGIAEAFGKAGRFLQKSVGRFGPQDVVEMFQRAGVETKVESTGKIFPRSDRAIHVRDALQTMAIDAGAQLHLKAAVCGIAKMDAHWSVQTSDAEIRCDRVIVTAGGKSWPGCGTTGDAYAWLHQLGHRIVKTRPALVPLVGGFDWTRALSGLTLDDCQLSVFQRPSIRQDPSQSNQPAGLSKTKRKALVQRRGGFLFTHFGFSGPTAMDVSGTMTGAESLDSIRLVADFLPSLTETQIREHCTDRSAGNRKILSTISRWLPSRLAETLIDVYQCDIGIAELSKIKLDNLIAGLKQSELSVQGTRGFAKAEVTAGGVELSQVDPRTMESKIVPGLFIAGEVLDVDGWIGGYNFQSAFSTGRAAGIAASEPITTPKS